MEILVFTYLAQTCCIWSPKNKKRVYIDDKKQVYSGTSDTTFQERYCTHAQDFNHDRYSNCTELLKFIWQLKKK